LMVGFFGEWSWSLLRGIENPSAIPERSRRRTVEKNEAILADGIF